MNRPPWRLLVVLGGVLALHVLGLIWWQQARSVSGDGAWHVNSSRPFRVKATVLKQTVLTPNQPEAKRIPQRPATDQGREAETALPPQLAQPAAPAPAGNKRPWAPLPSDYLAVEQVDAFPHPQDDWQLDWSQVPITQTAWRITVRLWVSANGQIDHLELLDSEPHADWVNRLLAPLPRTPMAPAQLAGQAVPVSYVVQMAPDQLQ